MSATFLLRHGWLLVTVAVLAGCGGGTEEEQPAAGKGDDEVREITDVAEGVKQVDSAKLPKLADYLPPQAGGVEIAGPEGWSVLGKESKWLARFTHKERTGLPRIEVTVADSTFPFTDVAPDNVAEFAAAVKALPTKNVIEPAMPLVFGDSAWSRYVKLAKFKSEKAQVQSLQTVRKGKLYTIDLLVEGEEPKDLKKYKDYGYAVAAGMKFGGGSSTPAPVPENSTLAPAPEPDAAPNP